MQANAPGVGGTPERTFERITVVRELLGRKVPIAVVHAFGPGGAEIAALERYALDAPSLDVLEKDARITMSLRHPNIGHVRDVWREGKELHVASELIEGETLEHLRTLAAGGKDLTLEVGVRIMVDLLAALSALHALGAGGLTHGEVTAANVIVGFDGTTRLVRPFRGHVAGKVAEPDWLAYAAPEVIRGNPADVRADLFSVGVLLWETLSRRKLFPKATREGRIARNMPIGKPQVPADAAWAAPLSAVAERALANDPGARYTTAAEMAAAVRLAVRSKLAMPPRVAAVVDKLASSRILERRTANALPESPLTPSLRPSLRPSVSDEAVRALAAIRPSSRPPTPNLGAVAEMPVVPKAPLLPAGVSALPRPLAPPLRLAPAPIPAAPPSEPQRFLSDPGFEETSLSIDDAFEPARSSGFAVGGAGAGASEVGVPLQAVPSRRRWMVIAGAAMLVVLIAAAAIGVIASRSSAAHTPPRVTDVQPSVTATITTASTPVTPSVTTATPVIVPMATSSSAPDTSSSAEVDPAASDTPNPEPSHRPHAKPRPTYDPMGI